MKYLFLILILVSSCSDMPVTQDDDQCMPVMVSVKDLDGVEWISTTESYCLCRKHRFSLEYIGIVPATQSWKEPIMNCNKVVGWKPEAYGRKSAYFEKVRQAIKAKSKRNK